MGAAAAAAVLAGSMALSACGSGSSSTNSNANTQSSTKQPIIIGTSLSLSGDYAVDGVNFKRGYEMWAKYQNAHGGLLGRPVKLKILSDASSPDQVVTNYQNLITLDHVQLLFGPFSTLLTVPAEKIAHRYGYAFLDGAGGGPAAYAAGYNDYFEMTSPVIDHLLAVSQYIKSLPPSERPTTAAYATSNNPFTQPVVQQVQKALQAIGVKTVYSHVFPAEVTDYTPIADAVASSKAQIAIIGTIGVPDGSAFIQTFVQDHYNPQMLVEAAGPDQGTAWLHAVGTKNTNGVMVPNPWYPGAKNALSEMMVKMYTSQYHVPPSSVSADVAGAFAVGEVMADAVKATHSINNSKIIAYLHSGVTLQTVEGPAKFNAVGENSVGLAFIFQWQNGVLKQVLPVNAAGSTKPMFPKPPFGG